MCAQKSHVHFIGISGIGMSSLAKIAYKQGMTVSGCDLTITSPNIKELQGNALLHKGHGGPCCFDQTITAYVYSTAAPTTLPELQHARTHNRPILHRSEFLQQLMSAKQAVTVAGSHGKTTTSSLIAHIMTYAQKDPSFVVGGMVNQHKNAQCGTSNIFIAEADESDRSLLHYTPKTAIITNIDFEHAETYTDINDVIATFQQYINNITPQGTCILNADDQNIKQLNIPSTITPITYGIQQPADIMASNIMYTPQHTQFTLTYKNKEYTITSPLFGLHNVYNLLAAYATCLIHAVDHDMIQQALDNFKGVSRRYTHKGMTKTTQAHIIDDYAHHPKELLATLSIAQQTASNNIIAIFQPHRYSRTQALWQDFITTFGKFNACTIIISDIYAASEQPINNVSGEALVIAIKKAYPHLNISYIPFDTAMLNKHIIASSSKNDTILLLGAGNINILASDLQNM